MWRLLLPNLAADGKLQVSRGVTCRIEYAPVGVVAGVSPSPDGASVDTQAIVGGNAFILKPSEQTPLSMIALGELFRKQAADGCSTWCRAAAKRSRPCATTGHRAFGFVGHRV